MIMTHNLIYTKSQKDHSIFKIQAAR